MPAIENRFAAALLVSAILAARRWAALKPGDKAPDFTAAAALGGKPFTFALADALKKGPVVGVFLSQGVHAGLLAGGQGLRRCDAAIAALGASVGRRQP